MPTLPITPSSHADLARGDATALRAVAALALTAAAVWLIGAVVTVLTPLVSGEPIEVVLLAGGGAPVGSPADVPLLISETYRVLLGADDVSSAAFALLLAEAGIVNLVGAFVAAAVAFALRKIARGEAFHRALPGLAVGVGFALSAGMLLASGIGGFGRMMVAEELNAAYGVEALSVGAEIDVIPVLVGFAVLGLAAVFRVGSRLQRETAGLV